MPKKPDDRNPGKDADLESFVGTKPLGTKEDPYFAARVDIHFYHYRDRLADIDNLSGKYVLDEIVNRGILRDDSAKEVAEVRHFQIKVKSVEEEKTVVVIGLEGTLEVAKGKT